MKLTRRQLATAVSVSAAALAQSDAQAQASRAANPADELQAARDRLKANGELLAQQQIPMTTEPAFQFKA